MGQEAIQLPEQAPRPALTWRQAKVLRFICAHIAEYGYPPTLRETADACGLVSTSSVSYVLDGLMAKGYITRLPRRPRAVRVVAAGPSQARSTP